MVKIVFVALFVVGFIAIVAAFAFAFTRRKGYRSYSMRMAVFVVVLTFVLATLGLIVAGRIFYFHGTRNAATSTTVRAVFTSQTYDLRSGLFNLEGSVWGLAPGWRLWVVFRDSRSDRLFPAQSPCEVLPENRFSCLQISTGAPSPNEPNVKGFLITAAPGVSAAILRGDTTSSPSRPVNFHRLPDGVALVGKIAIGS